MSQLVAVSRRGFYRSIATTGTGGGPAGDFESLSRKVVGWAVDRTLMSSRLSVAALEHAVADRQPQAGLVHHSDLAGLGTNDSLQLSQVPVPSPPCASYDAMHLEEECE